MSAPASALICCRGLTRVYRKGEQEIRPLDNLDLDITAGTFTALMGPSGSGKTTLLNLMAGVDRPTAGTLTVDGTELTDLSEGALAHWRSANVGYVFQLYNLVPVLTAYENVELPLLLHADNRRERHRKVALALDLVAIADRHDHYPRQLSGGQEQRVAIARALVTDPRILVADEPTGDLDAESATAVLELLRSLRRDLGKTLVMVTHDPHAASYADDLVHLEKGRIVRRESDQPDRRQLPSRPPVPRGDGA